jgi:raffinose/stachyose/melibiose transport system substrate-binding protein
MRHRELDPFNEERNAMRKAIVRKIGLLATGAVVAAALSSCSALTPGAPAHSATASGKKMTASDVRGAGKVTLHMTDYQSTGGLNDALNKDIKAFEAAYPNITVARTVKDPSDYDKTINLNMSASNAPDIAQSNAVIARTLVPANLVIPLDSYFKDYNWTAQYPTSIQEVLKLDSSGKTFGTGHYWGTTPGGNMVGVYYNAATLKKFAIAVPKTFAEFQKALATIKSKGVQPIELGNLDQYPGGHLASTLIDNFSSAAAINNWINGKAGSTFESPAEISALTTMRQWVQRGYISNQTNGTKDDDAATAFASGKGVFEITGSWRSVQFDQGLGQKGAFMILPSTSGALNPTTGSIDEAFTISAKSKHADLAAFFLNYLQSPACAQTNLDGGYLPFTGSATVHGGPIAQQVLAAWRQELPKDGLTGYLDSATPSMGDSAEYPALQSVLAGKETPAAAAKAIQANWTSYHSGS